MQEGLAALGMPLAVARRQALIDYVYLLAKWNAVYNLTAIRDPRAMVTRHLLDSLAIAPYLYGRRLLDAGTGAGLPGMALALADPARDWVLLDSSAKKTRFLTQVLIELAPPNVELVRARLADYHPPQGFDGVVVRALGPWQGLIRRLRPLARDGGRLLIMHGAFSAADRRALRAVAPLRAELHRLAVPGLDGERHLIEIAV